MTIEREHPRYAHEAVVTLHVGGKSHCGKTQNMSRGGVCADIAEQIPLGTDLEVDIQLVFEDVESEPLRLPARVVWNTALDESFQVGLSFQKLTPEMLQYLTIFVRYLEDPSPKQRSRRESTLDKRFG